MEYPRRRQYCGVGDLSRCVQCLLINHYVVLVLGAGHMLHLSITHSLRDRHQEERGDTVILKLDIFQLGGSQAVHTMVDCNNYPELGFLKPEHLCKLRCSEHLSIVNTVGCCWPRSLANISITNC